MSMSVPPAPPSRWRVLPETKQAFKTTELVAYVVTVVAVLIAAALVDDPGKGVTGFGSRQAWLYVTILTVGYMISRGLAKSGSRESYDRTVEPPDRIGGPDG